MSWEQFTLFSEPPDSVPVVIPRWCECGHRSHEMPFTRCPGKPSKPCGGLVCDLCGHSEGLHRLRYETGDTSCTQCGCGLFRNEELEGLE